jgi:hypothetical protein
MVNHKCRNQTTNFSSLLGRLFSRQGIIRCDPIVVAMDLSLLSSLLTLGVLTFFFYGKAELLCLRMISEQNGIFIMGIMEILGIRSFLSFF